MDKIIIDSLPLKLKDNELKHEVFNPKSNHFLDFGHFIEDSKAPRGLNTVTKIAHGFRLTAKGALYLPKDLKDALPTLISPYPVPVKERHESAHWGKDLPEIGRVTAGKYIDDWKNAGDLNFSIRDAVIGNHRNPKTMAAIKAALKGRLGDPKFEGLGYVLANSVITDKDAIEKILDKRFLTVSVEMVTNDWIDSVTGKSIMDLDMDPRDYKVGEVIDGVPRIRIADGFTFEGYAYTSRPADKHAQTIEVNEIQDSELEYLLDKHKTYMVCFDSSNSSVNSVFDSLYGNSEENMEKDNDEENCDINDSDSTPSTVIGDEMKVEDIIKFLGEDEAALKAVLDSNLGLKKAAEVDALKAEIEASSSAQILDMSTKLSEAESTVKVLRNEVELKVVEGRELNASLETAIADHKATLDKFAVAIGNVAELSVEDSAPLNTVRDSIFAVADSFDWDGLKTKLATIGKPIEPSNVQDPGAGAITDSVPAADKVYSKNEINVAKTWKEKNERRDTAGAKNYLSRMIKDNLVPSGFNPQEVIDSIKG